MFMKDPPKTNMWKGWNKRIREKINHANTKENDTVIEVYNILDFNIKKANSQKR